MLYSVLIPWLTLREVSVEVEIVGHPCLVHGLKSANLCSAIA